MDGKYLIFKDSKDITNTVKCCKYNTNTKQYDVVFLNEKIYSFNSLQNARWKIVPSCLCDKKAEICMKYLKEIATVSELKGEDDKVLLRKQYDKIGFIDYDNAMALYLNPAECKPKMYAKTSFIFPFGGNSSQFKAVEAAITNQISVIQGPPGTGKTQTILNIIANLLVADKTMQIVSNNNAATLNVLEKLNSPKYNMGFLIAALGNADNKVSFVKNQSGEYPELINWRKDVAEQNELISKINVLSAKVLEFFSKQERLAKAKLELDSLMLETKYFEQYCSDNNLSYTDMQQKRLLKSETLMKLWQECYGFSERERSVSFWFKIKGVFIYKIANWSFYKHDLPAIITFLQSLFYKSKEMELHQEIESLTKYLDIHDAQGSMNELTSLSMEYLCAKLFDKYGNKIERKKFKDKDLWQCAEDFIKEYPIVLSTTFSSRSCLNGVTYDYIIMDEASQVDIATGALALSSANNAVIVGDLKQLPNVVSSDKKGKYDDIFKLYNMQQGYSFSENSFLKSICSVIPDIKQTLLREHYRCHPKIIGFCNQKFYNNELVVMTEDKGEADTLLMFKTNIGNHCRDHMNQRQIDIVMQEALPIIQADYSDIGIIAPYNNQVNALIKQLYSKEIEVDTVHKFQGREKDTIVLTTVDDVVKGFSDNPNLLNVSVSRAKNKLCLIVSGNEQLKDGNTSDLIDYIQYNNFQVVESKLYSVFDLLYQHYTEARIAFLKKYPKVSVYDSENIMYAAIKDLLASHHNASLNIICHQPLYMLIKDTQYLDAEEYRYAMNNATHVDFLIYNRISKKPVLAIEVDGFHYHKKDTKQHERDKMKDNILRRYGIPIRRFSTAGSSEIERLEKIFNRCCKYR